MVKFGNHIIFIDTTYSTNMHDFNLVTVMVTDESGEGLPALWSISNREDCLILTQLFRFVQKRIG